MVLLKPLFHSLVKFYIFFGAATKGGLNFSRGGGCEPHRSYVLSLLGINNVLTL